MNSSSPFVIYNASAGSGKTFSLVKEYLKTILEQPQKNYFKNILAITFTNKAVAEMKERIVASLVSFASGSTHSRHEAMLDQIIVETKLSKHDIVYRSQKILKHLLHHYAQFSVETIDHFNHRLIRTFARDLELPANFEISLDVPNLIAQAVDQLIEKAGEDPEITNMLLAFALQKTDDDKSWDIAIDLKKAAALLLRENDAVYLQEFEGKSVSDFIALQEKLRKEIKDIEIEILRDANSMLELFLKYGLNATHFNRGSVFNFFTKIAAGNFQEKFTAGWQEKIETEPLYPKRVKGDEALQIDALVPQISASFTNIKQGIFQYHKIENFLKNLIPLATLHLVYKELQDIKEEESVLPISEFNALIYEQIKDQPVPFIYERLGDRYRNFFIDEFQDTSKLQWLNLIPLIDNAIAQEFTDETKSSLLIVGDAKQSIYRWRGGLPEQFINLYGADNPFSIPQKVVKNLDTNYRSHKEIIAFNNQFFSFLATHFGDATHQELYKLGNSQKYTDKNGGYISLSFIEANNKDETYEIYPRRVYETIINLLDRGYTQSDICILTRRKKEGVAISEYLTEKDPNIFILSEETLLLKNSELVRALVNILTLVIMPKNEEVKFEFLIFLHQHLEISESKHSFFATHIKSSLAHLSKTLLQYDIEFNFSVLSQLSLYEIFEYSIENLKLDYKADTFVNGFMDLVHRFSQKTEVSKMDFLSYWDMEAEKATVQSSKNIDAIHVMTIHKSKGLEFPVVLFPFANVDIYRELEPKAWYPYNQHGFKSLLISYKSEVSNYGDEGALLAEERKNTLELDNLNLLYVALTRAEKELYILTETVKTQKVPSKYSSFFKAFLEHQNLWEDTVSEYSFGTPEKIVDSTLNHKTPTLKVPYIVSNPAEHRVKLVTTDMDIENKQTLESIRFGNLIHDTMAQIEVKEDVALELQKLKKELGIATELFNSLSHTITAIVSHPEIEKYFLGIDSVYNERAIITPEKILRPDRINIHSDNTVTVIDYKTGEHTVSHNAQINSYALALEDMGFSVVEKLILYCNSDTIIVNKL